MSRIHEALNRAKLERSNAQEGSGEPSAHGFQTAEGTDLHSSFGVDPLLDQAPLVPPTSAGASLRVEELLSRCSHPTWNPDPAIDVFDPAQTARGAEQFRTLRSRLYQLRGNQALRIVLVTSSVAGEGKTFVAANLARAIVRQPDRRALLIDADLRCSRLHVPLGAPSSPGLTDYLRSNESEFAVTQGSPEGNLCFIPGGTTAANPSELLANGRLKALLDRVAGAFDWIFIDSPPCLPVSDASIVAAMCDSVLLVVKAGSTPSGVVQRAQRELQDKNIAGVILNSVDEDCLGYGSYYEHGYGGEHRDSSSQVTQ
jgi:protein-tyrosine kinase